MITRSIQFSIATCTWDGKTIDLQSNSQTCNSENIYINSQQFRSSLLKSIYVPDRRIHLYCLELIIAAEYQNTTTSRLIHLRRLLFWRLPLFEHVIIERRAVMQHWTYSNLDQFLLSLLPSEIRRRHHNLSPSYRDRYR